MKKSNTLRRMGRCGLHGVIVVGPAGKVTWSKDRQQVRSEPADGKALGLRNGEAGSGREQMAASMFPRCAHSLVHHRCGQSYGYKEETSFKAHFLLF